MEYRTLGRTGDETARRIVQSARERGVNFIDTADNNPGHPFIGRVLNNAG